jgi:hypothetical protein
LALVFPAAMLVAAFLVGVAAADQGVPPLAALDHGCPGHRVLWTLPHPERPACAVYWQALVFLGTMLAAAFLVLLRRPTKDSPLWLPWITAAWALLLPLASTLQVRASFGSQPPTEANSQHIGPIAQIMRVAILFFV